MFAFVIVIVIVFVVVFLMVRSCPLVTLITCLRGHKSLRVLYGSVFQQCVVVSQLVSQSVSDKVTYRAVWGQLKSNKKKHDQYSHLVQHKSFVTQVHFT